MHAGAWCKLFADPNARWDKDLMAWERLTEDDDFHLRTHGEKVSARAQGLGAVREGDVPESSTPCTPRTWRC